MEARASRGRKVAGREVAEGEVAEGEVAVLPASRLHDSFAFHDGNDPADRGNLDLLLCAVRPEDLHFVHLGGRAQPEVQALIGAGSVAASAENIGALADRARRNKYFRADRIPRAFRTADQL